MDSYSIKLNGLKEGKNLFSFKIKSDFFYPFNYSEIKKADISVISVLNKENNKLKLDTKIEGVINNLSCDICLGKIDLEIISNSSIVIKETDKELESTDEIFYITPNQPILNLHHLFYEMIVLALPNKKTHCNDKNGKSTCDDQMINLINKFTKKENSVIDDRWEALKELKIK